MDKTIKLYLFLFIFFILYFVIFFCQRNNLYNLENFTSYNWRAGPWSECHKQNITPCPKRTPCPTTTTTMKPEIIAMPTEINLESKSCENITNIKIDELGIIEN